MSKAKRRRNKKARRAAQMSVGGTGSQNHAPPISRQVQRWDGASRGEAIRPTDQRIAKGVWAEPVGALKSQQPIVDLASDMVGRLHCDKHISDAQEQAARSYQATYEAYIQEMPEVSGYKSCLAGGSAGHDESEGDPAVIAAMRGLQRRVGMIGSAELHRVCISDERPANLNILRKALDVVQC